LNKIPNKIGEERERREPEFEPKKMNFTKERTRAKEQIMFHPH
jgi:hypothetical protein